MLDNDRRRLELAYSLLFTLPGTPMMQYGDEIGMGDDLALPERECARTPMQWSGGPPRRLLDRSTNGPAGDLTIRSTDTSASTSTHSGAIPHSLLNWMERMIRMRKECPEISWGDWKVLKTNAEDVLVIEFTWRGHSLIVLHNFVDKPRAVQHPGLDGGHASAGGPAVDQRQPRRGRWLPRN